MVLLGGITEMIDTLTAYKCSFRFLQRNNPLIGEQRNAIKDDKKPDYSFLEFLNDYTEYTKDIAVGESSHRAISLSQDNIDYSEQNDICKWHIIMSAGKQGQPVTVVKIHTKKRYNYGSDTAALYNHHVFFYQKSDSIIAIFHRQNGSGCKSVFLETANKAIKSRGIKLEMELIMPMSNSVIDATPTKITLQYKKDVISSDVADNIVKHKKSYLVRELGLNLSVNENSSIMRIFRDFQLRRIPSNEAFALIKAEINDSKEYNDAEVNVKIGNRRRKIKWNEFKSMMGTYDISEKLYNAYSKSKDFVRELYILVDEYYNMITDSEVI